MKKIILSIFTLLLTNVCLAGTYPINNPCIDCKYPPVYLSDEYLHPKSLTILDGPYNLPLKINTPYTIRCKFLLKNFNGSASLHVLWSGFHDEKITYIVNNEEFKQYNRPWEAYLTLKHEFNVIYFKNVIKKQESDNKLKVEFRFGDLATATSYSCVAMEESH